MENTLKQLRQWVKANNLKMVKPKGYCPRGRWLVKTTQDEHVFTFETAAHMNSVYEHVLNIDYAHLGQWNSFTAPQHLHPSVWKKKVEPYLKAVKENKKYENIYYDRFKGWIEKKEKE